MRVGENFITRRVFWPSAFILAAAFGMIASAYALRARDSAIRGWSEAAQLQAQLDNSATMGNINIIPDMAGSYRSLWYALLGQSDYRSDLEFSSALADYIHSHIIVGGNDIPGTIGERLSNALLQKGEEAACGDLSLFLNHTLMASGITSRIVQLATERYVDGKEIGDTHVTVEILLDKGWVIIDPTFDATFTCGEDTALLNVASARDCVAHGRDIQPHYGPHRLPGRGIEDYYLPIKNLFNHYIRYSTEQNGKLIEAEYYPTRDWLKKAISEHYTNSN